MEIKKLTRKELAVMKTLWESSEPLTSSEIKQRCSVNPNTALVCIRNLLRNNFIKVADIVYSGNVLSRSYAPAITEEEYAALYYCEVSEKDDALPLIKHFIDTRSNLEELDELEEYLQKKRKSLQK